MSTTRKDILETKGKHKQKNTIKDDSEEEKNKTLKYASSVCKYNIVACKPIICISAAIFPVLFLLFFVQSADIIFFFFPLQSPSLPFPLPFCTTLLNLSYILASSSLLSLPGVIIPGFNCTTTTLLICDLAPCFSWCPAVDAIMLE